MAPQSESQAPPPGTPTTREHVEIAARAFAEWLSRPRVRLAVIGVILLLAGGLQLVSSVWTLPLVLAGALMVVTAWIGHRLEGRFAVEWGKTGTQLEFRARLKSPQDELPALPPAEAIETAGTPPPDAEVIEGEAHTVEIDVAELRTLLAAVEGSEAGPVPPDAAADAIRILRVAAGDASTPED